MNEIFGILFMALVGFFTIIGVCEVFSTIRNYFVEKKNLLAFLFVPLNENKNLEQAVALSKERLNGFENRLIVLIDDEQDKLLSIVGEKLALEDKTICICTQQN